MRRYSTTLCFLLATFWLSGPTSADELLLAFDDIQSQGVKLDTDSEPWRLHSGHAIDWPGITLKAPHGRWNLAQFGYVAVDVKNLGTEKAEICCRVDNPGANGVSNCLTGRIELTAGQKQTLRVVLDRRLPKQLEKQLFGMRGFPGGRKGRRGIDATNVTQLLVFLPKPKADHAFEISRIRAGGTAPPSVTIDPQKFFPMIDSFGQYMHMDWPGKLHSADEFAARAASEEADLAAHPAPKGWNQYGGFEAGPQREATGRFRVEKLDGKWWLIDPEGRLFWSHGIDCVRPNNATTPITDREHYFADLPKDDSPLAQFFGSGNWAPHGYYQGRGSYRTFNFTGANLLRKYGPQWKARAADMAHRRLRSWGMNTVANWSDSSIYLQRKTPYVATIHFGGRPIEGSQGYWGKFPDVFDPDFRAGLARRMARQKNTTAGDPWCLGYFVGNELSWGDDVSLAIATLASPAEQPAKKAMIADLKAKYQIIERLNQVWATAHDSWDALLASTTPPTQNKARDDLAAFYTHTAEEYFRICRQCVKEVDPEGLYLGCRFAWVNDRAVGASAKYCDVVSFNRYRRSVAELGLPEGVDKPIVIGEFHFGALDRGMFHTGLVATGNQQERAAAYVSYVRSALSNPLIVGTHWFQYGDQATTGRGDGENYQIGFLDVCDTPYPETVKACREVGYRMYERRLKGE